MLCSFSKIGLFNFEQKIEALGGDIKLLALSSTVHIYVSQNVRNLWYFLMCTYTIILSLFFAFPCKSIYKDFAFPTEILQFCVRKVIKSLLERILTGKKNENLVFQYFFDVFPRRIPIISFILIHLIHFWERWVGRFPFKMHFSLI